jgi:hypothetical protein
MQLMAAQIRGGIFFSTVNWLLNSFIKQAATGIKDLIGGKKSSERYGRTTQAVRNDKAWHFV